MSFFLKTSFSVRTWRAIQEHNIHSQCNSILLQSLFARSKYNNCDWTIELGHAYNTRSPYNIADIQLRGRQYHTNCTTNSHTRGIGT